MLEKLVRSKAFVLALIVGFVLWPVWPIFIRPNPSVLADPPKYVLLHLGFTTCVLLAIVLSFSPLRILLPKVRLALALNRHRRLVGVSTFVVGLLHFTMHILYEGGPAVLASDITKPFLVTGMLALTILTLLAATSSNLAIRLMGGRNWKRLHRFAYVAAGLAAYHQSAAQKLIPVQVYWIFTPLALLEAGRIYKHLSRKRVSS